MPSIPVSVSVSYRTALDSIGSVGHVSELSPDVTKMKIFIWGEREREEKRERERWYRRIDRLICLWLGRAESADYSVYYNWEMQKDHKYVLQNLISFGFTSA